MKKYIALSIVGLLIMAFSATVYAQPKLEFKIGGFFNMETFWYRNVQALNGGSGISAMNPVYTTPGASAWNRYQAWTDQRTHMYFDFIMGKELSGRVAFELDSTRWGDMAGDRGRVGYWTTDRSAVEIKHAYIDFLVPVVPIPINMRVGAQPWAMRPAVFLTNDGAGIKTTIKIDPAAIDIYWAKPIEGSDWNADDADVYGLHANAKIGPVTAGGYGFYYNMNNYPLNNGAAPFGATLTSEADMWWLGLYADGKLGPVNLNFDAILDTGKVKGKHTLANAQNVKYRGWMTKVKIDFPWEMFNFGVQGMYGSGSDRNKTNTDGLVNGTNEKVGSFVVPPGSEAGPASSGTVADNSVLLSVNAGSAGGIGYADNLNYGQMNRGPDGGLWWAKIYGAVKPTPWYKVTLQALYIGDTTKNGNTLGTARNADGVTLRNDKTIGWEADLINEFNVYANLKFDVGLGVLFVRGDALEMWDGTGNVKFRVPFALSTKLTYNF